VKHLLAAGLALVPLVVHADLAARIKAMAEIPSNSSPVYSRDGKRIAFISNRSGTPQVWIVDAAGGEPKQITQGTDPVGSVAWSPVEDRIAYAVARGGGFNVQVYYSKPDGSDAKLITSGGKEDNFSATSPRTGATGSALRSATHSRRIRGSTIRRPASLRWQSNTTGSAASSTFSAPTIGP
jgi:hypothetical protein